MKRQEKILSLVALALVGFGLMATSTNAQNTPPVVTPGPAVELPNVEPPGLGVQGMKLSTLEVRKAKLAVDRMKRTKMSLVVEEFTGSFTDVAAHFNSFNMEFGAQGLDEGLNTPPISVLVLYEDPTDKAAFRMAVGLEVPADVSVKAKPPLKAERFVHERSARYTHMGSYDRLKDVHDELIKVATTKKVATARKGIAQKSRWPVILRLHDDPKKTPADRLVTQMIVPF